MTPLANYCVAPIGHVRGVRPNPEDDYWGGEQSRIELVKEFDSEALLGLQDFSHVEVIFLFHEVSETKVITRARHPRNNTAWPKVGIFSQRGKSRPNRIGSTICKVVAVSGSVIVVEELDAIDGTPVLDIKPVMKQFLPRADVKQPAWSTELMADYWRQKPGENVA